ncbi:hypothetical protein [Shewanella algae]|uniref:hypothetical protein n=1 Tax=Shewanella algae TaxID=38313 RepID=UPI00118746F5|nr:hypothetical protein [Shewanella algae]TVO96836.1 hypothetical protein AYI86_13365 [Shewanella algae]
MPTTFISSHRLDNEACPEDLAFLLKHCRDWLESELFIRFPEDEDWAPWEDTSYLNEDDWADPEIVANVKAISDTCKHIAFVAELPYGEYLGYWRGEAKRPIAESPLVKYSNDGCFSLWGTSMLQALHFDMEEALLDKLREIAERAGWQLSQAHLSDYCESEAPDSPDEFHQARYQFHRQHP